MTISDEESLVVCGTGVVLRGFGGGEDTQTECGHMSSFSVIEWFSVLHWRLNTSRGRNAVAVQSRGMSVEAQERTDEGSPYAGLPDERVIFITPSSYVLKL